MKNHKQFAYNLLERKAAVQKWKKPINALLEKIQEKERMFDDEATVTLDENNPRHARRLKWMSVLMESNTMHNPNRSFINENGYGSVNPANLVGMGAITSPNPTTTGNFQTTAPADFGSGDMAKRLTAVSMHIASATVAFDLLPVIPLESTLAEYRFVETVYGHSRVDDEEKSPDYIQIPKAFFKAVDAVTTDFGGTGVAVASGEAAPFTKGQVYALGLDGAIADQLTAGLVVLVRFVQRHHITGARIFQVVEVKLSDATGALSPANGVTVADFLDQTATNGYNLSFVNAALDTATVTDVASVKLGTDAPVVDLVATHESHIAGASNRDGFTEEPMDREVSELGTERLITLRVWSAQVKVRDYDILCSVTNKQHRDLKAAGFNAFEIAMEAAKNDLIQSTNNNILDTMFKLGVENHIQIAEGLNLNLHLYAAAPAVAGETIANMGISNSDTFKLEDLSGADRSADFGTISNFIQLTSYAETSVDRIGLIKARIRACAAVIGQLGRAGQGNICVMNTQLGLALVDTANDARHADISTINQSTMTLYYVGKIGNIDCYVDPRMDYSDNRILVGRRGNEMDSGLKYMVYDLVSQIETIEGQSMSKKALVSTSYALMAAGFHPEVNYLTIIAENASGYWI